MNFNVFYIIAGLGIFNALLVLFQLFSGLHFIKVNMNIHKRTGIILAISAVVHGLLAFLTHL